MCPVEVKLILFQNILNTRKTKICVCVCLSVIIVVKRLNEVFRRLKILPIDG